MPPNTPKKQPKLTRSHVIEVIERRQEEAMQQLRQSGLPETDALLAMQRIAAFCLRSLRLLDELYLEFEALEAAEGRSDDHQDWFTGKCAGVLLTTEAGIANLVTEAIRQVLSDVHTRNIQPTPPPPRPEPRPMSEPARHQPFPLWFQFLLALLRHAVWVAGLYPSLIVAYSYSASADWMWVGPLLLFLLWLKFMKSWWALWVPLLAIAWWLLLYSLVLS